MIKEINYSGLSTSPSDYNCADGELAAAVNMVPEDGALQRICAPDTVMTLSEGEREIGRAHV